jgi:hypothetical protein
MVVVMNVVCGGLKERKLEMEQVKHYSAEEIKAGARHSPTRCLRRKECRSPLEGVETFEPWRGKSPWK